MGEEYIAQTRPIWWKSFYCTGPYATCFIFLLKVKIQTTIVTKPLPNVRSTQGFVRLVRPFSTRLRPARAAAALLSFIAEGSLSVNPEQQHSPLRWCRRGGTTEGEIGKVYETGIDKEMLDSNFSFYRRQASNPAGHFGLPWVEADETR